MTNENVRIFIIFLIQTLFEQNLKYQIPFINEGLFYS